MLKKVLLSLITVIILFSCRKKEELIIDYEIPESETKTDQGVIDSEKRPLIVVSESDVIEILVRSDGAPGMYLGDDGEVHGFYVDLEKMIMDEMGQRYHFFPYDDLGPVYQGIKTGVYHMALAVPEVPDYVERVDLSIPYEILHYVTFVQKSNTDIRGASKELLIQALHGKKVGVQTQGHIYQALRHIKEINLIEYPTTTKALEALNQGLLDAVPDVKRIGDYYIREKGWHLKAVGEPVISHKITTGFSKALDPSLLNRYNAALEKIIADGRLKNLWESYYGPMEEKDIP